MKMQVIKQEVYGLTCTTNTTQLKKEHPSLTDGRDLRYKEHWLEILSQLKTLQSQQSDLSLAELEQSEKMLKNSLFRVGRMAGLDDSELETDWQRIKLEAQFEDIHIEEL